MKAKNWVSWGFHPKSSITAERCTMKVRMSKMKPVMTSNSYKSSERLISTPKPVQTEYKDNWIEKLAINYLSQNLQMASGKKTEKNGYEGLVEASCMVSRNYSLTAQQELVAYCLKNCIPQPFLSLMKIMMPQSRFSRELFAASTTLLFPWLVGQCEVKDSELHGRREKSAVYIKKCRYLESTNCVGMCKNLCKMPTQKFIREELGMPINMVPDFENMSCEMIFGQIPPEEGDDPAFNQPCYLTLCMAKKMQSVDSVPAN